MFFKTWICCAGMKLCSSRKRVSPVGRHGNVGDKHGVTRKAALDEEIAWRDVGDRHGGELALQRMRAGPGEDRVHVAAERGVTRIRRRAARPGERAARRARPVAGRPAREGDRLGRARIVEGDLARPVHGVQPLGAQPHGRVRALLQVARADVDVDDCRMHVLPEFRRTAEEQHG